MDTTDSQSTPPTPAPAPSPEASAIKSIKRASLSKVLPPDRLAIDRQQAALRAYAAVYESNGYKPVTNYQAGEVVQPAKMAAATIVVTNAFFTEVGFLKREDDASFSVAPEVSAFLAAEGGLAPEAAPEKLKPLLAKQWFMTVLQPRLRLGPLDLEIVYKVLGTECGATPEHRDRLRILVEYLCWVGLTRKEGNQLKLGTGSPLSIESETKTNGSLAGASAAPQEDDAGLETYTLTLDPIRKRRIILKTPATVTNAELKRIQSWLQFQLIVDETEKLL